MVHFKVTLAGWCRLPPRISLYITILMMLDLVGFPYRGFTPEASLFLTSMSTPTPTVATSATCGALQAFASGKVIHLVEQPPTGARVVVAKKAMLAGHKGYVFSVALSPDGATIASGSGDKTVMVWDSESGQRKQALAGHADAVTSVTFSPIGSMIASGSTDKTVILWDYASGQRMQNLSGHTRGVDSVAFSPNGATIASGSADYTVILWDAVSGQKKQTLTGHMRGVDSVAFSPDGATIASGSGDKTIRLWDVVSGQTKQTLTGHGAHVWSVAYSRDGSTIASGSGDNTVILWDADSGQAKQTLTSDTRGVRSVAFSPDGATVASGGGDGRVILWDVLSGQKKQTLEAHRTASLSFGADVRCVTFSPDGATIASGSLDKTVILWDTSGKKKQALEGHTDIISSIAFSPDGATIASGSLDKTVILWDTSGKKKQVLEGHTEAVSVVAFSPDGASIASGSRDNTVILWDVASGRSLSLFGPFQHRVASVWFDQATGTLYFRDSKQRTHQLSGQLRPCDPRVSLDTPPFSSLLAARAKIEDLQNALSVQGAELADVREKLNRREREVLELTANAQDAKKNFSLKCQQLAEVRQQLSDRDREALELRETIHFLETELNSFRKMLREPSPEGVDVSDLPLTELPLSMVEEFCTVRFAARLIAPAQKRIKEMENNSLSCTASDAPIATKGLEAERRRTEIASTLRSLEATLGLCQVDYSLDPTDLDPKLQARDSARVEAARLWELLQVQRDEFSAYLQSESPKGNMKATKENPSSRDIYARIEQKELSNLKECTNRVAELIERFIATLKSDAIVTSGPASDQYQLECSANLALRYALMRSNRIQIQKEFDVHTAEMKRQLALNLLNAEQTLSGVEKTIADLEPDMQRIIDITKSFPFGSDGTTPRAAARNGLVSVKSKFVDPIKLCRHKKNQLHLDLQFYQDSDPDKCTGLAKGMDALDAELTKLAEAFISAYDDVVMKTRVAFPELEEYVHTHIDPFCGQGNFRMDLGPADFNMTKLYGETVFKASPIAGVVEAKKLDSIYVIKKFSVLASFLQELAVMRNAKAAGKHHENVAEACFSFSQKDIGGVVYYYIGLPFYRCPSPDWFIARIKLGEKGAMVQAMEGMVKGLDCLHRNQIVHGDVKPANLLFDSETPSGVPKWIDFNFSANRSATLKLRGLTTVMAVGFSEGFTPREQRENLVLGPAGDVYALGKTFAALLFIVGCSPWEKDERAAGTWLGDEVEKLLGPEIHAQIVTMIQCMTTEDEGQRISLLTDCTFGTSVLSRLESIRKTL